MARPAALLLLLAALAALASAPLPSSAAPCFHGGRRLTSAPISLKAAAKNRNDGAASAHSSFFDGVADPVRESGYFKLNRTHDAHMFYMYFESRAGAPASANDPVVLWMTGGPGCSSELAVFFENGPFRIEDDLTLSDNPFGWDVGHNILFIDQPVGTGFSFTSDPSDDVTSEKQVADDVLDFLLEFYDSKPELLKNDLFITGESYAGHYVPAVASRIVEHNGNAGRKTAELSLKGVAIGNGLTDPAVQYGAYADYAASKGLIGATTRKAIRSASHDLHSVSVPAHFNEPLTETQRHVEIMQHSHLLDEAAGFPPESPARLLAVFGFACSLVSTCVRTSKPFKDMQGGTFEMVADDDDNEAEEAREREAAAAGGGGGKGSGNDGRRGRRFRALAEKVQHSPPVVAFCVQGENWTFEAHDELHVELSLRGLKMHPRGACRLTFIDEEREEGEEKKKEEKKEKTTTKKKISSTSSSSSSSSSSAPTSFLPPPLPLPPKQPDEYRWNTPAFYVRDIVPSGSPGHMMRVCHKGPFFAKCTATGDAVVAVAAEAEAKKARVAAARGEGLMSSVSGRYEPGPGRPAFAAEVSGRLDGVVVAKVKREHTLGSSSSSDSGSCARCCRGGAKEGRERSSSSPCSCSSPSPSNSTSLLGCDPSRFDGGGGRGFSGHAREVLSSWKEGGGDDNDGGDGDNKGEKKTSSSSSSPFVLLPLFRGTTAHHRSQRGCGPWGMSPWACSLNDAPEDLLAVLPLTDARRRKDVALVERGDGDGADAEKERMEARQRVDRAARAKAIKEWKESRAQERRRRKGEARRKRTSYSSGGEAKKSDNDDAAVAVAAPSPSTSTAKKEKPRPFGTPQWFHSVPGTDVWGNPYSRWVYKGGYWESRENREWPKETRDPYC